MINVAGVFTGQHDGADRYSTSIPRWRFSVHWLHGGPRLICHLKDHVRFSFHAQEEMPLFCILATSCATSVGQNEGKMVNLGISLQIGALPYNSGKACALSTVWQYLPLL